ncbi:MAG TPA: hypothetical protein VG273_16280 [Bryobacteraceae bacterium]|jgi:hypothetical protein|nr:hypothetical protein [Bryobacteraceae bacterium]
MFDLRLPSGIFFAIIGAILIVMGLTMPDLRARMSTANVDLYAGSAMFAFGAVLLLLASKYMKR